VITPDPQDAPIDRRSSQGDETRTDALVGEWRTALASARVHMKNDRITVAAGSFAYRWFLALFPIIIALLAVSALVDIPRHVTVVLINGVTKALPAGAAGVFTSAINHSGGHSDGAITAIVIAGVVALWSATSGMVQVEEGLDMAYELGRDRSFIAKRVRAIPLLLAAAVLGGAASALVVFGQSIGQELEHALPFGGGAFLVGWTAARWIVALALVGILFSVLYYAAPNRPEPQWKWITPGAVVGTVMWAAISLLFSLYTTVSGSYSKTYGAFAGVAILIFWLYLSGIAILLGGEINAAFERQGVAQTPKAPEAESPIATPPLVMDHTQHPGDSPVTTN
jgi:membrane protein